jgi:hypothetical protein
MKLNKIIWINLLLYYNISIAQAQINHSNLIKNVGYDFNNFTSLVNNSDSTGIPNDETKQRWLLGAGLSYDNFTNTPGLNLNITYRILGHFHIGPDFSAFLNNTTEDNGNKTIRKEFEFNLNGQQLFEVSEKVGLYPYSGLNWSKVTTHLLGEEPNEKWVTGINLGGGIEIKLKKIKLFSETKYVTKLDKWDISAGILFFLGGKLK